MKIKAAVTWEKGAPFKIEEVELAEPKKTEVLVKVAGVGICHTDAVARDQGIPVPLPAVLGHEGAGIVEKVGEDVKGIEVGDHVVISFYSCGKCEMCRSGHPNLCEMNPIVNLVGGVYADGTKRLSKDGQELSCFFGQSTYAEYAVTDQENCVVIDKDVDLALMGPLGCGIQTGAGAIMNTINPEIGSTIAIFGCGAVGLSAIMMAKNAGCSKIIGVDAVDERLKLAMELGATDVINGMKCDDISAEIIKLTGAGADYSLETSAVPALINQALYSLRVMGTCVVVGSTGEQIVPIKMQDAVMASARTLKGDVEGASIPKLFIPKLIELYKAGKFPFDKLITEFSFDQINEAFESSHNGKAIKPVIRF